MLSRLIELAILVGGAYLAWQSQEHEKKVIEVSQAVIEVNNNLHHYLLTERDSHRAEIESFQGIKDSYLQMLQNYSEVAPRIVDLKRMEILEEAREAAEERNATYREEMYALSKEYQDLHKSHMEVLKGEVESVQQFLSQFTVEEDEEDLDNEDEDDVESDQDSDYYEAEEDEDEEC